MRFFGLILVIMELMKVQLYSLLVIIVCLVVLYFYFTAPSSHNTTGIPSQDTVRSDAAVKDTGIIVLPNNSPPIRDTLPGQIATGNVQPEAVVAYAESLLGTPYLYASSDPAVGFDCSGFITYVFNHFQIKVPRSSIDFTNVGKDVAVPEAKRGDIILFTGTDSTERFVGHMGIIVSNVDGELQFIHSSSGKAYGVTVSPLKGYYTGRFVKVIRIFSPL
jgi:cell wall-associated NlpC family hydrolase